MRTSLNLVSTDGEYEHIIEMLKSSSVCSALFSVLLEKVNFFD
jgi:hypothetical protein